jgi:hypothetical protein
MADPFYGEVSQLLTFDVPGGTPLDLIPGNSWGMGGNAVIDYTSQMEGIGSLDLTSISSSSFVELATKPDLTTGDWTMEVSYEKTGTPDPYAMLITTSGADSSALLKLAHDNQTNMLYIEVKDSGGNHLTTNATGVSFFVEGRNDILVERDGVFVNFYNNGTRIHQENIGNATLFSNSQGIFFGGSIIGSRRNIRGRLDNIRITPGRARAASAPSYTLDLPHPGPVGGDKPIITVQPQDRTVDDNAQVVVSVTATSATPYLTYQWYANGSPVGDSLPYYQFQFLAGGGDVDIYCEVTDPFGTTISETATVSEYSFEVPETPETSSGELDFTAMQLVKNPDRKELTLRFREYSQADYLCSSLEKWFNENAAADWPMTDFSDGVSTVPEFFAGGSVDWQYTSRSDGNPPLGATNYDAIDWGPTMPDYCSVDGMRLVNHTEGDGFFLGQHFTGWQGRYPGGSDMGIPGSGNGTSRVDINVGGVAIGEMQCDAPGGGPLVEFAGLAYLRTRIAYTSGGTVNGFEPLVYFAPHIGLAGGTIDFVADTGTQSFPTPAGFDGNSAWTWQLQTESFIQVEDVSDGEGGTDRVARFYQRPIVTINGETTAGYAQLIWQLIIYDESQTKTRWWWWNAQVDKYYGALANITGTFLGLYVDGPVVGLWEALQANYIDGVGGEPVFNEVRGALVWNFEDNNYTWMDAAAIEGSQLVPVQAMSYEFDPGWATRWNTQGGFESLTWADMRDPQAPWNSRSAPLWLDMADLGVEQNLYWLTTDKLYLSDQVIDTSGVKRYFVQRTGIDLNDLDPSWTTNNWKHIRQFYFHLQSPRLTASTPNNFDIRAGWSTNLMDDPSWNPYSTINLQKTANDGRHKWDTRTTGRYLGLEMDFSATQAFVMTGGDIDVELAHGR